MSQRPHRVRTWSPKGQTPILQYNFNWDKMSAVAGITFYNFYFRLYKGSVKSAEVVEFLGALLRHIPGPLTIVWDRLSSHKSRITNDFITNTVNACVWNTCRVTRRNSTRSSTSGLIGSSTRYPMFARKTSGR